jgi:hypothetical protein
VIAVEIHQATANSTDISFEMDLYGVPLVLPARKTQTGDKGHEEIRPGSKAL